MVRTHTSLVVLAVVTLLALAGCAGGGTPGDAPTTTPVPTTDDTGGTTVVGDDGTNEEDTDDGTNEEDTDDGTNEEDTDDGTNEEDTDDGADDDTLALTAVPVVDSFTAAFSVTTTGAASDSLDLRGTVRVAADGASLAAFEVLDQDGFTVEQYQSPDGAVFIRSAVAGQETVRRTDSTQFDTGVYAGPATVADDAFGLTPDDREVVFRSVGIVDTPNGQRAKYVLDSVDRLGAAVTDGDELRSVALELYLTPDDSQLRELRYDLSFYDDSAAAEYTLRYAVDYTDLGTTVVDEPAWTSRAVGVTAP
jgi:hypothetical protein